MATTGEHKAAKYIAKAVSDVTFDPMAFAFVLAEQHPEQQRRVMIAFLSYVKVMAAKLGRDDYDDINADAVVTAKRIVEALEQF